MVEEREQRLGRLSALAMESSEEMRFERRGTVDDNVSLVSNIFDQHQALSPLISTCVIINYISIGYLFLPWAFAQAGTVLSCLGLLVVSTQSYITATYVLEACARAESLARWSKTPEGQLSKRRLDIPDPTGSSSLEIREPANVDGATSESSTTQSNNLIQTLQILKLDLSTMDLAGNDEDSDNKTSNDVEANEATEVGVAAPMMSLISRRRFEMSELCRIFLGKKWEAFFVLTTAFDLYGITWSFAIVSASSLQENLPILEGEIGYKLYALIFACVVVPLSCVDIADQLFIQMSFLFGRMLMVLVMLVTVAIASGASTPHFEEQVGAAKDVPMFDFHQLYIMMQVAIFSTAYQFSVPTMSQASVNRERMGAIFGAACSYIAVSTMTLSLVLAIFFGQTAIETSSNLNWAGYHGGTGVFEDGALVYRAPWARLISGFVVCFPPFDFLAVFPLCAMSLGEILMGAWYGSAVHKIQNDLKPRTVFRIIASTPQIIGAVFVRDIEIIANYAGLFTVASYSICPALLAIYSRNTLEEVGMFAETAYQTPFSSNSWAWAICIGATALICYVVLTSAFASS